MPAQTQETQLVTKETQKVVLRTVCEHPTLSTEEIGVMLKTFGKSISQEEVIQVVHSISPNKNWHRASKEDAQKEILEYVWILESQILFLLPTKQKETTIAEFNQFRLQNKQVKVHKDLVRHLLGLLMVDGKNLSRFRKFEKDLVFQNDVDPVSQAYWAIRIILANINTNNIAGYQELTAQIVDELKHKFAVLAEKIGKSLQRLTEKFLEKYFPKNISDAGLKELITTFQSVYSTYRKGTEKELLAKSELYDQGKLVQNVIEQLHKIQEIINESHEGGFLGKLVSGEVKNKEGLIKKINEVINSLGQVLDLNNETNRTINEKILLVQKLQSDYENTVLVKSQLENDLYALNEKFKTLEEENNSSKKELKDKIEQVEKAQEKISKLQEEVNTIPEYESRLDQLREELAVSKSIAISLYLRISRLKTDLLNKPNEKSKNHKTNAEQKTNNGNNIVHKFVQDPETGQTVLTTEVNSIGQNGT